MTSYEHFKHQQENGKKKRKQRFFTFEKVYFNSRPSCRLVAFFNSCPYEWSRSDNGGDGDGDGESVTYFEYDLMYKGAVVPKVPSLSLILERKLATVLRNLFTCCEKYKTSSIGFLTTNCYRPRVIVNSHNEHYDTYLKGSDLVVWNALKCAGSDFQLEIVPVKVSSSGKCPYDDGYDRADEYLIDCLYNNRPVDFKVIPFTFL